MAVNEGVTLVTGSNGGLGNRIVDYLIRAGVRNIACHYRSSAEEISGVLEKHGLHPEAHCFYAELTDEESVSELRQSVEAQRGSVNHLINLAGGSSNAMSWKVTAEEFRRVIDMNLTTTFLCCREFIPPMRAMAYGRIINVASIAGFRGASGAAHYAAAKAAIAGYSKSLSLELAEKNITVNVLAVGYCNTGIICQVPEEIRRRLVEMTPIKRLGTAEEVAHCIRYLLGPDAAFVTGQVHHLNGGLY